MRLHVVSLPHTETTRAFSWCAYTQKVRRFCDMMTSLGHEVVLYAGEANEAKVAKHVVCITRAEQADLFGTAIPVFDANSAGFRLFAERAVKEIRKNGMGTLCLIGGVAQAPIANAMHLQTVEFGVGYEGVFAPYRVFESNAWMHVVYGYLYGAHTANGFHYDAVIPNYFEVSEFPAGSGGDYLLYLGRLTERKGILVAGEIAERTGRQLIVAGSGDERLIPAGAEYVGNVGSEQRARLLGGAAATLCPTQYVEPFGGAAVESMLCGTPVLSTDYGAFTETIRQGVDGYRCRDLGEFAWAAEHLDDLNRLEIRSRAVTTYSTDVVRWQYQHYLDRLATLERGGWYTESKRPPAGTGWQDEGTSPIEVTERKASRWQYTLPRR